MKSATQQPIIRVNAAGNKTVFNKCVNGIINILFPSLSSSSFVLNIKFSPAVLC